MNYDWSYICGDYWAKDDPFIAYFCSQANVERYPKGYRLIRQGDPCRSIYLPLKGYLKNSMAFENGNTACNLLFTGNCLLGISSMDSPTSQIEVQCLSDCQIAAVPSDTVSRWSADALVPIALCQTWKMEILYRQLRERSLYSAEEQLMKLLQDAEAAGIMDGGPNPVLRPSLLAEMLNLSRVQLSAVIAKLDKRGQLSSRQKKQLLPLKQENISHA